MRRLLRRLSLRVRLLRRPAGLLTACLGVIGTVLSTQLEIYLLDRLDSQLRSLATITAQAPLDSSPVERDGAMERLELVGPALELFGSLYLTQLDEDGDLVEGYYSPQLDRASLPPPEELRRVPADGTAVDLRADDGSGRWRAVGRPVGGSGRTVIAAAPLTEAEATIARIRTTSVATGSTLLALLTIVGWFALGGGLRPLRRIEHTAASIAEGDLSKRVPDLASPGTEIGRLSTSLNTMLGQLERAFADRAASETRMRLFVGDVSHELRTPLFGIKGSTELYRMGALTEQADVDEAMHRIHREAVRLAALTEDLLLLAQLDQAPEAQFDPAPMDLRTLANDARHDLRALDPSRPVELTGPGGGPPAPAPVHGDEARLRQVVTNLVGNAAAHTPPGTPVRVGVGRAGDRAVLEVADEGPGMTAEQAGRVFDRFYRTDRSRDRSSGVGAGLGLAIARSLAQAHGGDVELETSLGAGACFRLVLPLPRHGSG